MYSKIFTILFLINIIPFLINYAYSVDETPIIPGVPEPEPEPEPIQLPTPKPIPDPFPEESDSAKIERLTQENEILKNKIQDITFEKNELELEVIELNKRIEDLQKITMEQIKVIMELFERIKQTVFALSDLENNL